MADKAADKAADNVADDAASEAAGQAVGQATHQAASQATIKTTSSSSQPPATPHIEGQHNHDTEQVINFDDEDDDAAGGFVPCLSDDDAQSSTHKQNASTQSVPATPTPRDTQHTIDLTIDPSPEETKEIAKSRSQQLQAYRQLLATYTHKASGGDLRGKHLAAILQIVLDEYAASAARYPLPLMRLSSAAKNPIFFQSIQDLATCNRWIDGSAIDWLVGERNTNAISYIPTHEAIYAATIAKRNEAIEGITKVVDAKFVIEHLTATTNRVLVPWNPTGGHWVLVDAMAVPTNTGEHEGQITIFDTCGHHASTWTNGNIWQLKMFLGMLGANTISPLHMVDWTDVHVTASECLRQDTADCGVFVIWLARCLLGATMPPSQHITGLKARALGELLRLAFLNEIADALTGGGVVGPWSKAIQDEYCTIIAAPTPTSASTSAPASASASTPASTPAPASASNSVSNSAPNVEILPRATPDDMDVLIQERALGVTPLQMVLAVLEQEPDGLMPDVLFTKLTRRWSATRTANTKEPDWRDFSTSKGLLIQTDEDGGPRHPDPTRLDRPITINPAVDYACGPDARALFGTDVHVHDNTDDIRETFDIVLSCSRSSAPRPSGYFGYRDELTEAHAHVDALYDTWNSVCNRLGTPHTRVAHPDEVWEMEIASPIYIPFLIRIASSTETVFSQLSNSSQYRESIKQAILHYQELAGRPISVLFIYPGCDGLTTSNRSWGHMVEQFPLVQFSLTSVNYNTFEDEYPCLYTKRGTYSFAHLKVNDLAAEWATMETSDDPILQWLQRPKEHRFFRSLQVLQESKVGRRDPMKLRFKRPDDVKRLTIPRHTLLDDMNNTQSEPKTCESCGGETERYWTRGAESQTVRCDRCP